jgi:hypothetical protein
MWESDVLGLKDRDLNEIKKHMPGVKYGGSSVFEML